MKMLLEKTAQIFGSSGFISGRLTFFPAKKNVTWINAIFSMTTDAAYGSGWAQLFMSAWVLNMIESRGKIKLIVYWKQS